MKTMTTKECKELSGKCYVLPSGTYNDILKKKIYKNFILYPERALTLHELALKFLPPSNVNVITENPWIIGSYDFRKVFVLDEEGEWVNPDSQTFGASVEYIMDNLLGISTSISRLPKLMLTELIGK